MLMIMFNVPAMLVTLYGGQKAMKLHEKAAEAGLRRVDERARLLDLLAREQDPEVRRNLSYALARADEEEESPTD